MGRPDLLWSGDQQHQENMRLLALICDEPGWALSRVRVAHEAEQRIAELESTVAQLREAGEELAVILEKRLMILPERTETRGKLVKWRSLTQTPDDGGRDG